MCDLFNIAYEGLVVVDGFVPSSGVQRIGEVGKVLVTQVSFSSFEIFDDMLVQKFTCFRWRLSRISANLILPFCWLEEHAPHRETRPWVSGEVVVQNIQGCFTLVKSSPVKTPQK